jgi:hypothetical protein
MVDRVTVFGNIITVDEGDKIMDSVGSKPHLMIIVLVELLAEHHDTQQKLSHTASTTRFARRCDF